MRFIQLDVVQNNIKIFLSPTTKLEKTMAYDYGVVSRPKIGFSKENQCCSFRSMVPLKTSFILLSCKVLSREATNGSI